MKGNTKEESDQLSAISGQLSAIRIEGSGET
jgi:hypothetical protein